MTETEIRGALKDTLYTAIEVLKATHGILIWEGGLLSSPEDSFTGEWRSAAQRLSTELSLRSKGLAEVRPWPSPGSPRTTIVAAPVEMQGKVYGSIAVLGGEGILLKGKRQLLRFFADVAAFAVTSFRARKSAWISQLMAMEQALLSGVSDLAAPSYHLGATLDRLLRWITMVMTASRGSIMLLDETKSQLTIAAAQGIDSAIVRNTTKRQLGEGISGWVAQHKRAIRLAKVEDDPRFSGVDPAIKDSLIAPLLVGDNPLGVLSVANKLGAETFTDVDLEAFSILADYVADRIAQALTYGETLGHMDEGERSKLAREIHDGIIQELTSVVMQLEITERLYKKNPKEVIKPLRTAKEQTRACLVQLRQLTFDLRLSTLKELGLIGALREQVAELREEANIATEFGVEGTAIPLSQGVERNLFLIAREALLNIKQHANAKNAEVRLSFASDEVELTVGDDGCGFDVESVLRRAREERRFGLLGMSEKSHHIGGRLTIDSAIGKGTKITAHIPVRGVWRWMS
jgi:signal transduction histidine kinase